MNLEAGKCYKTRLGHKAFVFSTKGHVHEALGYIELHNGRHEASRWSIDGAFFCDKSEAGNDLIAEWTEPKPPQYVPYTADDLPMLRGRWYRIKDGGVEAMVIRFSLDGHVFCMNGLPSEFFLNECVWLDGTPCGKVVTE